MLCICLFDQAVEKLGRGGGRGGKMGVWSVSGGVFLCLDLF